MRAAVLLLALSACAGTFGGPERDRGILVAAFASTAADTATTLWLSDGGRWDGKAREANPLLGCTPSATVLVGALLATSVVEFLAWRFIHPAAVAPIAGVETSIAVSNVALGMTGGRK